MKSINSHKKNNLKVLASLAILFLLLLIVLSGLLKEKDKKYKNLDNKIGLIATDGVALLSISSERKMINFLSLEKEVEVWLPGEGVWEKNNKVAKMLLADNKNKMAKDMFWYNFGFFTDKIIFLESVNDWKNDSLLLNNLGFIEWVKYKISYDKMFLKKEQIRGALTDNEILLGEIMVRDFSESSINNEELRISIFNNTNETGLATFIGKRFEWSGFSVISTDNNNEKVESCLAIYGDKVEESFSWNMIKNIFYCDTRYDQNLNEGELELYFGDNLPSVINYSSYFK